MFSLHVWIFALSCWWRQIRNAVGCGGTNLWLIVPILVLQVNEMASARRSCRNKLDVFCYICGEYTIGFNRKPVTSFTMRAYYAYFGIKLADQDKVWVPHMVWKAWTETLRWGTNGKRSLNFGIPMVWRQPTNHVTDCYFGAVDVTEINRKNRGSLKYPDLQSVRRPVAHCDEIPCLSSENFLTLGTKMPPVL